MRTGDKDLFGRFSFGKALFFWVVSYALFLIIAGFASSFYMSDNMKVQSQSIKTSFKYYVEKNSVSLPVKKGEYAKNFERIIVTDDMDNIISQTGDRIEGLIKNGRTHYGTAFENDGVWISDFAYDIKLDKNTVALGFSENNTNYMGIMDAYSFMDEFSKSFDHDQNFLIFDSHKYGFIKSGEKIEQVSAFTADKISWHPGSLMKFGNRTYFYSESKMGMYSIYSLNSMHEILMEYFLPLVIPFVIGIVFISILKFWSLRENDYFNSHFKILNDIASSKNKFISDEEHSYSKVFTECAASISDLAAQNDKNLSEIRRLTEKSSHLSENLRDTMFKIASLNQFFQKFSISEDYSIRAGISMLCRIMIEAEESLENAELLMNGERLFIKKPDEAAILQGEKINVDYSGMKIEMNLRFQPWINQQDTMLKTEIIKNTFFTLSTMYALKKENRNDRQTGLMSFEFFSSLMKKELYELERYNRSGTLLMMDFSMINQILERYGETAYEKILGKIGKVIRNSIRESDMAAKYSIDRILIFFPETTLKNCMEIGTKLVNSINEEIQKEFFDMELGMETGASHSERGEKALHVMIEECSRDIRKI